MERQRWAEYIEVSSNVAVLVVAMALLGALGPTQSESDKSEHSRHANSKICRWRWLK